LFVVFGLFVCLFVTQGCNLWIRTVGRVERERRRKHNSLLFERFVSFFFFLFFLLLLCLPDTPQQNLSATAERECSVSTLLTKQNNQNMKKNNNIQQPMRKCYLQRKQPKHVKTTLDQINEMK
jgi:hypothetical protein